MVKKEDRDKYANPSISRRAYNIFKKEAKRRRIYHGLKPSVPQLLETIAIQLNEEHQKYDNDNKTYR